MSLTEYHLKLIYQISTSFTCNPVELLLDDSDGFISREIEKLGYKFQGELH